MKFTETKIKGAFVIEPEYHSDERGAFARLFCAQEFKQHSLNFTTVQTSVSLNTHAHTLRGMHYQKAPHSEAKIVLVTKGIAFDVMLDLRQESETFMQWQDFELSDSNHHGVFIPAGVAHGFQTLTDHCEVFYMMNEYYHPDCASGVRWNDPAYGIHWPDAAERIISTKDQQWPLFDAGSGFEANKT